MTRLKLAELTSGIGALVLGIGLGALFAEWLAPAGAFYAAAGIAAHGFGMWDKHRLDAEAQPETSYWVTALYWVCWLLLAVVGAMLFVRR